MEMTYTMVYSEQSDITSCDSFVTELFKLRRSINEEKLLFRGQSDAGDELLPSIGRKHEYAGCSKVFTLEEEIGLLHRFQRRAYPAVGRTLNAGEALFLARHHGLPTRLLDWTANALFALYFGCVKKLDVDGALWAIGQHTSSLDPFEMTKFQSPTDLFNEFYPMEGHTWDNGAIEDAIFIVYPFFNSPRLVAQDGAFTYHTNPRRPMESYHGARFWRQRLDIKALYKWRIPKEAKIKLIRQLSGLGITHRAVFPDLDGIAQSLWETVVLWFGDHA